MKVKTVKKIKIKKLLPQSKVVQVKKGGTVVRTFNVRRKTYFPGTKKSRYY